MPEESASTHPEAKSSGIGRDIFCVLALAAVVFLLLHESLFTGKGLVAADAVLKFPPWNRDVRPSNFLLADQYWTFLPTQELMHREKGFPLWNPYICCGAPNLGAIQGALFFPIRLLLAPLGPFNASGPAAFIKLCMAGWFTILYMRLLGVTRPAALFAGIVFSLSGFMIVWLGHPHVNCAMWLPLLLWFVEKSFRLEPGELNSRRAFRLWVGFALAYACLILGGHPPTAIHVTLVVMTYFGFRFFCSGQYRWQRIVWLAGAIGVGLLLAAPQILPFIEYYRNSSSPEAVGALKRWSAHITVPSLIHFLLPNALGSPALGNEDMPTRLDWSATDNYIERTGYVGILPLFLAAYGVAFRRCKFTWFFCGLVAASIVVIYDILPFSLVLRVLPILSNVDQTRLFLVVGFGVAVLAAFGWDELTERARSYRRAKIALLDAVHHSFLIRQVLLLGGGLVAVVVLAIWPKRWPRWVPMVLGLGWTCADLLCFGTGFNPSISRELYYPSTPAIEWLKKDDSLFRVFGGGTMLPPNTAQVFGLSDARAG